MRPYDIEEETVTDFQDKQIYFSMLKVTVKPEGRSKSSMQY
jgi:hypothetical protein